MALVALVYLGGVLSILSPCILPVVPFVFARGDQPFSRSGLPLLAGMAVTFAAVATLAAVAGGWAVDANQYGRYLAIAVLAVFALTLLSNRLAAAMMRPVAALGDRVSRSASFGSRRPGILSSLLLGVATGLLWAPCAGPILGLVLTTAALKGASGGTSLLLLAYGLGAASSLALVLLTGGRLLRLLKQHLGAGVWIRRGLGAVVLGGVIAVATGLDTDLLSMVDFADTSPLEQKLIDGFGTVPNKAENALGHEQPAQDHQTDLSRDLFGASLVPVAFHGGQTNSVRGIDDLIPVAASGALPVERALPSLSGATEWLNSAPLSAGALRGKVVLVEFWTYACINCRHVLPHVKAWAEKYRDAGLVAVGVHTPELAFEKVTSNVRQAVRQYGITYPVAVDTNSAIWNAFGNEFWPANYFVDTHGRIRYHHFGEEDYRHQEQVIQELLREAGNDNVPGGFVSLEESPRRLASAATGN